MSKVRRKISAVYSDFINEINRMERFDATNQVNFASKHMTKSQLHQLTESIFFNLYRDFEIFIRDIFLLYCQGKRPLSGKKVESYLMPKSFVHAEDMIRSSMPFLDWTSVSVVIDRADAYLKDGFPVKIPYSTNRTKLEDYKKIRNHIAHNSVQSLSQYKKVLLRYLGVIPLRAPVPGEFLLKRSTTHGYILLEFFSIIRQLATDLVN